KGKHHELRTNRKNVDFYSNVNSADGIRILRTIMVGGCSIVTLANGIRALQNELKTSGIDLENEFEEVEKELGVTPVPERFIGERTKMLRKASEELGYNMKIMPKFIDFSKCRACGVCDQGCCYGAKWTTESFLKEAQSCGAKLVTDASVEEVLHSDGEVKGVRVSGSNGIFEINAENIVLAAGGIGTPMILLKSGLDNAGSNLFVDPFVNTIGLIRGTRSKIEMSMATVIDEFQKQSGFVISPSPVFEKPLDKLRRFPLTKKLYSFRESLTLSLMNKIEDDAVGRVEVGGKVHKPLTKDDRKKLAKGDKISREILLQAGASSKSLFNSKVVAAHPGGTAGIGRVVNTDQETEISRLFVSDASVLPKSPGLPPVLTIIALSKRFSKRLSSEYL
ncbi:GMC family oxidoreductase N-terminal domain-containing protein, partial [Candidatus Dojkabacteria bacterium]|nr:GMC family oxidoreductase N-terminal domain-containing protein [Candidatus Dojkabacteria bacterium]